MVTTQQVAIAQALVSEQTISPELRAEAERVLLEALRDGVGYPAPPPRAPMLPEAAYVAQPLTPSTRKRGWGW